MDLTYNKLTWQDREELFATARVHLEFVCKLYKMQQDAGRYFAHEHPQAATSWREKSIEEIRKWTGVQCLTIDQCAYGLVARGDDGVERPARKAMPIMANSPASVVTLNKRCPKDHEHTQLVGSRRTKKAQEYPDQFLPSASGRHGSADAVGQ